MTVHSILQSLPRYYLNDLKANGNFIALLSGSDQFSTKKIGKVHEITLVLYLFCAQVKSFSIFFMVLIFCVEIRELSHLTCDLTQAEKKITVVTS